jgi:F0F1-type ATP synthase membrane subunit c/vacuolar-type H+-ATPase subunit K
MREENSELKQRLLGMQIVALAMPAGAVMFALVAWYLLSRRGGPALPDSQVVSLMAAGFAVMMFFAHLMVPEKAVRAARQRLDSADHDDWYGLYQTRLISALVLLEGAAFFNLVALIVEQQWWSLGIAGGLVLLMLNHFPTQTRVEHWIETQRLQRH